MKTLRNALTVLAAVFVVAIFGCALGGVWTDHAGQVDEISQRLWNTVCVLLPLATASTLAAVCMWMEDIQ